MIKSDGPDCIGTGRFQPGIEGSPGVIGWIVQGTVVIQDRQTAGAARHGVDIVADPQPPLPIKGQLGRAALQVAAGADGEVAPLSIRSINRQGVAKNLAEGGGNPNIPGAVREHMPNGDEAIVQPVKVAAGGVKIDVRNIIQIKPHDPHSAGGIAPEAEQQVAIRHLQDGPRLLAAKHQGVGLKGVARLLTAGMDAIYKDVGRNGQTGQYIVPGDPVKSGETPAPQRHNVSIAPFCNRSIGLSRHGVGRNGRPFSGTVIVKCETVPPHGRKAAAKIRSVGEIGDRAAQFWRFQNGTGSVDEPDPVRNAEGVTPGVAPLFYPCHVSVCGHKKIANFDPAGRVPQMEGAHLQCRMAIAVNVVLDH